MRSMLLSITENTNHISKIERDSNEHHGFKSKHSKKVYRKLKIMKNKKVIVQILFSQKFNDIYIQCLMNVVYIRNVIKVKRLNNNVHDMFFAKIYD